ncbi:hypothetical protein OH77DRAFT_1018072 [Trametes cingulata]|nr:hypothetical protein OH77DRAFT_1018072 [Trametes cingulata]
MDFAVCQSCVDPRPPPPHFPPPRPRLALLHAPNKITRPHAERIATFLSCALSLTALKA